MITTTSSYANAPKKSTNVSLAEPLLVEAKELRINVSQAAEAGVAKAVAENQWGQTRLIFFVSSFPRAAWERELTCSPPFRVVSQAEFVG